MNIVHLIPGIGVGGGAEKVVRDLCCSMDPRQFTSTVLFWGDADGLAGPMRADGAAVVRLPLGRVLSLHSVGIIRQEIRRVKGSLLHTHLLDADWLGFWAAKAAGVPQVVSVHSCPFPENRRQAWRYRMMAPGISRIVCVSGATERQIMAQTGIGAGKFRVVHNGIDVGAVAARGRAADRHALRASLGLSPSDRVIGSVTRFVPAKGNEYLIRAFPEILARCAQAKLLIVGDGPLHDHLAGLASSLGLGDRVVFAGRRWDIPELFSIMDIFVFPTIDEAFGLALVEAMAAGLPVISSDYPAASEIVTPMQDGVIVPMADAGRIAQASLMLLSDRELAGRLGDSARQRALSFSRERMAGEMAGVYREALGK